MTAARKNRRGRIAAFALAMAALLTVHFAAGSAAAAPQKQPKYKYKEDRLVYAELANAPEKARARPNPMAADRDAVAAGANLFDQHCAECHGDAAEGSRKGPSLLKEQVQSATPGTLFWLITNGVVRRGMPVWSKLPEPQRWQLVTFLKSLNPPPPTAGAAAGTKIP
jgi:mono/diheme cytochrome c family protein